MLLLAYESDWLYSSISNPFLSYIFYESYSQEAGDTRKNGECSSVSNFKRL